MSFFTNILQYSSADNTQTENCYTEIFALILRRVEGILVQWLKSACIEVKDLSEITVESQVRFPHHNKSIGTYLIPDIVISFKCNNIPHTIFIENKVDSAVDSWQLHNYALMLDQLDVPGPKYLFIITKEYSEIQVQVIVEECTSLDATTVKYLRWQDIYRFFDETRESDIIIDEFCKLMEDENMDISNQISSLDILAFNHFPHVWRLLDEMLKGGVEDAFKNITGYVSQHATRFTQLRDHNRYIVYADQNDEFWYGIGFWIVDRSSQRYPLAGGVLEIGPRSKQRSETIDILRKIEEDRVEWEGYNLDQRAWSGIQRRIGIQKFLGEKDHVQVAQDYFLSVIQDINSIKSEYPQLLWRVIS